MLDKRANLLLKQNTYDYLASLAEKKEVSVSELIRKAIEKMYLSRKEKVLQKRQKAFNEILQMQKGMEIPNKIDYQELIDYGRRY